VVNREVEGLDTGRVVVAAPMEEAVLGVVAGDGVAAGRLRDTKVVSCRRVLLNVVVLLVVVVGVVVEVVVVGVVVVLVVVVVGVVVVVLVVVVEVVVVGDGTFGKAFKGIFAPH